MGSKGARSPAVSAATHGSLVVIEHRRTHETTVRCSLFALKSLTPSHTKAPRGPLFRPNACQNAARVATAHRPSSDIAQKRRDRAKGPPPAPRPHPPPSPRDISQKRARGAGAGHLVSHQPQPSLVQLNDIATNQKHSTRLIHKLTTPARGGGGLPLPAAAAAAPEKSASAKGERCREERQTQTKKYRERERNKKSEKTKLRDEARPARKLRVRRPTSQNQCFQGAKTTLRLHERQKASCEGPKCIIFHHNNEALEKTIKNKPLPPLATDAEARRTLGNAYLCMVSEGDRSHPVAAAVKKEPPSATHGSLVVIEHGRTRKTTIRYPLFPLETRTPSH